MLEQIYYGNSLQEWMISISIVLGSFLLNKIIILFDKHIIRRLTEKTDNRLDDILFKTLEAPVLLGIALLAIWIAVGRLEIHTEIRDLLLKSFQVLTVLNITWFVARLINSLIEEYVVPKAEDSSDAYKNLDSHLISIARRSVLTLLWTVGIVMALNNVGVNVGTLIAGLGIGGLAFALAAQDTIKNIFGGFTIFTDRPFRIGERIKVDGFDGVVEDIGIRSTRLRTLEKRVVTIPNYKIVEASVENVSGEPMRRVLLNLSLTYATSPEKMNEALQILKDLPSKIKEIDKKECLASFSNFSDSSLDITFIYYIKKNADIFETTSLVNSEILRSFNEAGIQFAFPTRTVILEKSN